MKETYMIKHVEINLSYYHKDLIILMHLLTQEIRVKLKSTHLMTA